MLEFGPLNSGPGREGLDPGNLGAGGAGWEDPLHLDWLTDHEVRYLMPPTQRTRYQTKVFQQSVTILIKLQSNNTGSRGPSISERGVAVGPWRVPEDQLPVLVGTITGASLLVLLLLTLLLYTCCHHNPRLKNYSVKSEVSSVTSGRTQGSVPSLSRDSLVVVTHASTGHQACLLSERDSPSDYLFECDCCCDPPCQPVCLCDYTDDDLLGPNDNSVFEDGRQSIEDLPTRSLSMPIKEQNKLQKSDDPDEVSSNNNNSVRRKHASRPTSNPATFNHCDLTLPPSATSEWQVITGSRNRVLEGLRFGPECRHEDQSASSSALDMVSSTNRSKDSDSMVIDDTFKTRSLPAWVRNKTRPLAALDDLNTIYEKPHWSKRRRNRMRSDAAAVIALSKSRGRLMSPGPQSSIGGASSSAGSHPSGVPNSSSTHPPSSPDTAALVNNEAVIVYDERTAL
ncbi:uncharacterized protein [Macrobrachium rosenbergii]|uniref:uncharacterized protein isoform X1 n=1 Tax=Macrobrachium rosenbergii TaxID=79674 RepID=UPI0034D5A5A3